MTVEDEWVVDKGLHIEDGPRRGEIAVVTLPVEAISHQVFVAHFEPPVLDGDLVDPAGGLVEQRHGGHRIGAAVLDHPGEDGKGETGVDDVLDHDHMTVEHRCRDVHGDPDSTPASEAVQGHEVDLGRGVDASHQIGREHHRPLHDHNEHRVT